MRVFRLKAAYKVATLALAGAPVMPNLGYVGAVEYWTSQFAQGALP